MRSFVGKGIGRAKEHLCCHDACEARNGRPWDISLGIYIYIYIVYIYIYRDRDIYKNNIYIYIYPHGNIWKHTVGNIPGRLQQLVYNPSQGLSPNSGVILNISGL